MKENMGKVRKEKEKGREERGKIEGVKNRDM